MIQTDDAVPDTPEENECEYTKYKGINVCWFFQNERSARTDDKEEWKKEREKIAWLNAIDGAESDWCVGDIEWGGKERYRRQKNTDDPEFDCKSTRIAIRCIPINQSD